LPGLILLLLSHSRTSLAQTNTPPDAARLRQDRRAYGGSASCSACHEEEFKLWAESHHALAERKITSKSDRAAFDPPRSLKHGSQWSGACWDSGRPHINTRGLHGSNENFALQRVIGQDPLRQFLVRAPGGRLQTLEVSYDPASNEWFDAFGSEDRQPGEWGHWTGRGMNWNSMCGSCHDTHLSKNFDAQTDSYQTTMAEMSVGCEACHGPLQAHNAWQKGSRKKGAKDPTLARLTARQSLDNCGSCHSRRSDLTGHFQPGDDFNDHFQLATVDATETFYADGQIRDEDYEFSPFLGSRMHARGVACGDCHDPHSMKTRLPGNFLCLRCHIGGVSNAPVINPVTHSHHKVFGYATNGVAMNIDLAGYHPSKIKETGGECVNCHMPQTLFMQRHWRHDHGFTIPDPLLTKQHDIPNACNRCHADKTTDWALEFVAQWYGDKMKRPTRDRATAIARGRNGDRAAVANLAGLLQHEESPYWRAAAAKILEPWAGETNVSAALLGGLADTNALVREACAQSLQPLAEAEVPQIIEAMKRLLGDPVRSVRVAAAWALRPSLDTHSTAGKDLRRMLDFNADQPLGQVQMGEFYLSRGNSRLALEHAKKAVDWDTHSPALRQELAVVLSTLGQSDKAMAQLEEAVRLDPRDAESHYRLALACNETGDLERAARELTITVTLAPQRARAWYNLGLAQNSLGETDLAIKSLARAESAEPQDADIPYARATILSRLGRNDEARTAARRALEIQPGFIDAQLLIRALNGQTEAGRIQKP
jgi:tetratricopeptide (TPR) repeat protein